MTGGGFVSASDSGRGQNDGSRWAGVARVKGPAWARLPLITIGSLGLQILWSVEMGYASPYLISLGMSKSHMSMVFVAGPLSGLIMQPLVGALSDRCTSTLGRRRPYLIVGTLVSTASLLLLGFTKYVASIFGLEGSLTDRLTLWLAVASICFIDFSVNAVMATSRALLVDVLPTADQEVGNAWMGRMSGLGSIAGFFVGNIKLSELFPYFGHTQLQVLSVLSGGLLILTNGLTAASVQEQVLVEPSARALGKHGEGSSIGPLGIIKEIWENIFTLPAAIMKICMIQFLSWIGWFPVLFYTTLWVSDIYKRTLPLSSSLEPFEIEEEGTRAGNRALLWSSIVAMTAFVLLPIIITRPNTVPTRSESDSSITAKAEALSSSRDSKRDKRGWYQIRMHVATLWCVSNAVFACAMFATWPLGGSIWGANVIIGMTGFSWAVSLWAPFALLGEQIHGAQSTKSEYILAQTDDADFDEDDIVLVDRGSHAHPQSLSSNVNGQTHSRTHSPRSFVSLPLHGADGEEPISLSARASRTNLTDEEYEPDPDRMSHERDGESLGLMEGGHGPISSSRRMQRRSGSVGDKAGVILGIHNVFVVIPQFLVTGLAAIVFAIFEPPPSSTTTPVHPHAPAAPVPPAAPLFSLNGTITDTALQGRSAAGLEGGGSVDSIGIMFRLGGFCAAISCILCWKLSNYLQR